MYCIYSDREIEESQANVEHIIPLSLGGCDDFTIQVEKNCNSILGSKVDGKMTKDFLVALERIKRGDEGHSGKAPKYTVKSSYEDGKPLISTFTKRELRLFDPIDKKYVKGAAAVRMETRIDLDTRIKFVAKVALATGYFLFGRDITKYADCDSLRAVMMSEHLSDLLNKSPEQIKNLRFYDSLHPIEDKDKAWMELYKMYGECCQASNVLWTYSPSSIIVHVEIWGKFVGCINFRADVEKIPKTREKEYWLGHILICEKDGLVRKSWREALLELCEAKKLIGEDELIQAKNFNG